MHMDCDLIWILASETSHEPVSPFVGGSTCFYTIYWYAQIVLTLVIFIYPSHLHTYHIFCNGNKLFSISSSGKYEEKPFFSFPSSSALTQCNNTLRMRQKPVNNHLKCNFPLNPHVRRLLVGLCRWVDWLVGPKVCHDIGKLVDDRIHLYICLHIKAPF